MYLAAEVVVPLLLVTYGACADVNSGNVTLHLGSKSKIVQMVDETYPTFLDPQITILKTDKLPEKKKLMPSIGNGYLATVVHSDTIYRSDMFNGYNITSHRARIPSTCAINITSISRPIVSSEYWLDVGRGMYREIYKGHLYEVELNMYAHRKYSSLLVTEIYVWNKARSEHLTLTLNVNKGDESVDLDILEDKTFPDQSLNKFTARTKEAEYEKFGKQDVVVISSVVPDQLVIDPLSRDSYAFISSISDDVQKATKQFLEGKAAYFNQSLESSHVSAWSDIWRNGRVELLGNDKVSRIIYSSLYYILSSIPDSLQDQKTFVGLSPGSLANGAAGRDYYGHVFWDQETWMFPPVLMLHTGLGKALVKTRIRTLDSAKEYAGSRGYAGAMYTWESAYSGLDVCPAELYSNNEQHITGDVALAFQQYMRMSDDREFLDHERGAEAIQNIAEFWASRVSLNNSTKLYEINGVMPPDEYQHFINNSVYTNAVAKISLQLVKEFASSNDNSKMQHYESIANRLYIPFNETGQWHPEFEGYEEGTKVKQADVILLGYPLLYDMLEETRKNDLNIYEKVTPGGPAMTWGMFTIGWLEIGNIKKAKEIFERQFLNNAGPFNIWTEVADGNGAVNFITGMGGFLQSVIFGYGGFRILPNQLAFNCNMPPETNQFNIYGLDYLGASLDFNFTESDMTITLTRQGSVDLKVVLSNTQSHDLNVGQPLKLKRQRASIEKIERKTKSTTIIPSHNTHDNGCQKMFVQSWLTLLLVTLCILYNVSIFH